MKAISLNENTKNTLYVFITKKIKSLLFDILIILFIKDFNQIFRFQILLKLFLSFFVLFALAVLPKPFVP